MIQEKNYDTIQEVVSNSSKKLSPNQVGFIFTVLGVVYLVLEAVKSFFSEKNQLKPDVASPNQ